MNIDNFFNIMDSIFPIIFILFGLIFLVAFITSVASFISPKFRGKLMARNVKAVKHMSDYSKEDLQGIQENIQSATIEAQSNIINEYDDQLRNIASKTADISHDAIKSTASAIASGISSGLNNSSDVKKIYCKYCGARIDADSTFCKQCGKRQ